MKSLDTSLFKFETQNNYDQIQEPHSKTFFFVESFDNFEFEVRVGSASDSQPLTKIKAKSNEDLNAQIYQAAHTYLNQRGCRELA